MIYKNVSRIILLLVKDQPNIHLLSTNKYLSSHDRRNKYQKKRFQISNETWRQQSPRLSFEHLTQTNCFFCVQVLYILVETKSQVLLEPQMNILVKIVFHAVYLVIGQQSFFSNSRCFYIKIHLMHLPETKLNLSALFVSLFSIPYPQLSFCRFANAVTLH